ncbi:hypothetical protein WN944_022064 [Citrus x changshan-huyou]|uniref:F-box domain-containing protein n=1 Tax=Citrus x changshan-huyou TaxID=2935761 RepID=A0AAP0QVU8_9ROSI
MDETVDADHISDLPTFIIHHIMSFLSPKDVVRTGILSTTWRKFQTSFPVLDFDQNNFLVKSRVKRVLPFNLEDMMSRKNFCKSLRKFIRFVDASLHRFCELGFPMQKLRISVSLLEVKESSPLFDKWVELAMENGVKELDFEVITDKNSVNALPQTIFSAKLLTSLKLFGCKLEQPSHCANLQSLKKLSLDEVYVNDQMVQSLVRECRVLEDLSFFYCFGLKRLRISEAHKLKSLILRFTYQELESVEIAVPSLQQLELSFSRVPRLLDVAECPHLRKLVLFLPHFNDQEFHPLISKFPLLEDLSIISLETLERIMISSNRLMHLEVYNCSGLNRINVDAPNLVSFDFEDNPIPIVSTNAPCPLNVLFSNFGDIDTHWYLNLMEFIGAFNQIGELHLSLNYKQVLFNIDEFRSCHPSLPLQVESLSLFMESFSLYMDVVPSEYEILLDGLFWIFYPKNLCLSPENWRYRPFVMMYPLEDNSDELMDRWPLLPQGDLWLRLDWCFPWFYDHLRNRSTNCSNGRQIKCWRHFLKGINVESFDPLRESSEGDLWLRLDWCFPE